MQAMKPTLGKTVEARFELRVSVVVSAVDPPTALIQKQKNKTKKKYTYAMTALLLSSACLLIQMSSQE